MAKFIVGVATNIIGSETTTEIEIPDDELEGLTGDDYDAVIYGDYFTGAVWEMIDAWIARASE